MSKFASALAAQTARRSGPPCTIGTALARLPKDEAADLRAALADPDARHTAIARALHEIDLDIRADTVGRHRRGDCDCPR
jgi:hypothetical protein